MTTPSHLVRHEATCPECGASVQYRRMKHTNYMKPKRKQCGECEEVFR